MLLKDFLLDDSGMVTTDWAMLTASSMAVAFTLMHQASGGVENLGNDIADELAGIQISNRFSEQFSNSEFTNGERGDWQGGVIQNYDGFGDVLAIGAEASEAQLELDVGDEYDYAVVEFDMIVGDSWDTVINGSHEAAEAVITINGEAVVVSTHNHLDSSGPTVTTFTDDYGNSTTVEFAQATTQTGAWHTSGNNVDYTYSVRVVTTNSSDGIVLGASTNLDQNTNDEFFALDNVSVRGSNTIDPNA